MPVVLGEEAEGHRGDGVVAPGAVQAAEQVPALLRGEGVSALSTGPARAPPQPRPSRPGPRPQPCPTPTTGTLRALGAGLAPRAVFGSPAGRSHHKGNADSSSSDPVITLGCTEPRASPAASLAWQIRAVTLPAFHGRAWGATRALGAGGEEACSGPCLLSWAAPSCHP